MAGSNVVISGTDPTNPRCAADIIMRLEQIERDTAVMAAEAGRLMVFSEFIREVLREEQGLADRAAVSRTVVARERITKLRTLLLSVSTSAAEAVAAVYESGVRPTTRWPEWKPTWVRANGRRNR